MSIFRASSSPLNIRSKQSCSSSRVRARGNEPVFPASRRVKNSPFSVNNSHAVHMDTTSTQTVCAGGLSLLNWTARPVRDRARLPLSVCYRFK